MLISGRTAILRGGDERENLGDVMMQWAAERLIRSLGFETIIRVGHGEAPAEVVGVASVVEAVFVLGSIQFSDAWAAPTLLERLERAVRFQRQFPRAKVVFLPSTWGAFEPQHRDALSELLAGATVLVRDRFSAEAINGLLGAPVADYCPDLAFTYPPADADRATSILRRKDPARPLLGVIPNQRCVEPGVTPAGRPRDYIDFLARMRDAALGRGLEVVGVSHMMNTDRDARLLGELGIACVEARDAEAIRSVIVNMTLCVCSRYHGLISCLSHGTPVLAVGWHHKYRNLMQDLDLGAHHLSVADLPQEPEPHLERLLDGDVRPAIARNVAAAQALISGKLAALQGRV